MCNGPLHVPHGTMKQPNDAENEESTWPEGTNFRVSCGVGYGVADGAAIGWDNQITGKLSCDNSNSWENRPVCSSKII